MANLKSLLAKTVEEVRDHEAALEREYLELGETLAAEGLPASASDDLKELLGRARESRGLVAAGQEATDRLSKLMTQLTEIGDKMDEKKRALAALQEQMEPHYEKVGKAALDALAEQEDDTYAKLIEQITALEEEIKGHNRELTRTSRREGEKGIVTQALEGGKRLYLQGLSRSKELRLGGLYRRLGREVCDSDLISRLDAPAFVAVLEPVLKNREETEKVRAQLTALENRAERAQNEVTTICGSERPQRTVQRLGRERTKAREVLEVQLRDLGAQFADSTGDRSAAAKKVKARFEEIARVRGSLEELVSRRERLEAGIAAEELNRRLEAERTRARSLETQAKKLAGEIAELNGEIKELTQEREKLLKVRGSLEELVPAPVEEG